MSLSKACWHFVRRAALLILLGALVLPPAPVTYAAADGNSAPTNVICRGWERDTVLINFKDNDTDEVDYRLERRIDGGAFSEIATLTPDSNGNYATYHDTGIDTTKNYEYRLRGRHADNTYTNYGLICNNRRIAETGGAGNGFRLFYGLEGTSDDCPPIDGHDSCLANVSDNGENVYVTLQKMALEGSVDAFTRVGFDRDASVSDIGLDKIPVNVYWCDGGGCAGGGGLGLSPALMETPFDLVTRLGDPAPYIVAEHEAFHFQQRLYGGLNDPAGKWVSEGQARSTQDKICIGANRAAAEAAGLCFDDIDSGTADYVGQVNSYLGNTDTPVVQSSYSSALFWTYLTEKFGTFAPADTIEGGMNLMYEFWQASADNPNRDGITNLNDALTALGHTERFRDIWKDFAVANYAKNLTGPGVPDKYKYEDMAQPGGGYNQVTFTVNQALALNQPFLRTGETILPWAAKYYRFTPANNVPSLDIKVSQDTSTPLYYTVLGIKNNGIDFEFNDEARNLDQLVLNDGYSEVVVIVAGLDNLANYRVSVNGVDPTLEILSPTTANKARVGSNTEPEKFRVAVRVLDEDGTPMEGVDLDNFTFRIGDVDVPEDHILTSAHVQDQQWFVLRAVEQDAPTTYDFFVQYDNSTVLSATQSLAVNYAPRTDADNMLVIDRSGSMAGNKLTAAKNAARLYVDSWRTGDMLGVIGYNATPNLAMQLEDWTDAPSGGTRQDAFDAIDGLAAGGGTNIGDSLMLGFDQLQDRGDAAHDWAIILLSDGKEEFSSPTVPFATAIDEIATASGKRPVIHAVAIGPNADGPKMQNAATATGGTYQFASVPDTVSAAAIGGTNSIAEALAIANPNLNLDARYRFIATEVLGHQQFFAVARPGNNDTFSGDTVNIPVEGSAAELVISLSFDGTGCLCQIRLLNPSATIVPAFKGTGRHIIWRVPTPAQGTWVLQILPPQPPGAAASSENAPQAVLSFPEYLVQSSIKSDVILDVALTTPVEERVSGVPMPIVASLTDIGPITGASVVATIVKPNGSSSNLTLFDDGSHGDGAANDGIYANTFYQTGLAGTTSGGGTYDVTVVAKGTSPVAGNFERQEILSFFIASVHPDNEGESDGDQDNDGLPDTYEQTQGGTVPLDPNADPTTLDPNGDPDNDGLPTIEEWENGTNPFDPDSDNGGESDGSEVGRGANPNDPSDDGIETTWAVAYPGVSKVYVRYTPRASHTKVEIWRSESLTGSFSLKLTDMAPTGMVTDTEVINDQEYCYYAVGVTATNLKSAPLAASCATPKADPWAPDGFFLINGGAANTHSQNVILNVFASDEVSPHNVGLDPLEDMMIPPASSATEVVDMFISNQANMAGATLVPYSETVPWVLAQPAGVATVYMQFRDAAGNVSDIVHSSINVVGAGAPFDRRLSLPVISNRQ